MTSPPPPLQTVPRVPLGLSICAGLAGLALAVGAASSAFLTRLFSLGYFGFNWDSVVRIAAIVALVGAILALMQHDAGGPMLAASGTVMAVVVATTITGDGFELDAVLDEFPFRGLAFLGAGAAGLVAAVLGLMCVRGRGKAAFGIANAVLAIGVLGCHAALFGLDDRQDARNVQPFLGVALILAVVVLAGFLGSAGAVGAAAGAACLIPLYVDIAGIDGFPRGRLAAVATIALAAIVSMSVVAAVLASRQQAAQYFGRIPQGFGQAPQPDVTQAYAVRPASPVTDQQSVWSPQPVPSPGFRDVAEESPGFGVPTGETRAYGTPAHGTPAYGTPAYGSPGIRSGGNEPTEQLPTIAEVGTSIGESSQQQFLANGTTAAASARAQWAPDPYGRYEMRYWDGQRWTQYVSNRGVTDTDPV